jgi:hypothetical protein
MWLVNTATRQVYHCNAATAVPNCVEALVTSAADAIKFMKQNPQKTQKK